MEVAHLILALGADLSGQLHLLNSGFDSIAGSFPGTLPYPLYVATKVLFSKEETAGNKTYSTAVDIVAPDGRVVGTIDKDILVKETSDTDRPVSHSGLVTFFALEFPMLGLYKVRQLVDGKPVKVIPLFIEAATESTKENPHGGE